MSHTASQFGTWSAPECPFSVEYSLPAMERVRQHVLESFYSIPRGGAEAGGVLFGKFVNGQVRILAAHAAACEHATGPTFSLSPRDQAAFRGLLFLGGKDGLAGMQTVGWYRSRTRGEPHLSEEDVDLWSRFFPHPWQLMLVLRPASVGAMRAAVFFREEDGSVRTECVYPEFQLLPYETYETPGPVAEPEPAPEQAPPKPPVREAAPRSIPLRPLPRARQSRGSWWGILAALLLLTAGLAAFWNRETFAPIVRWWQGPPVDLRMEKDPGGILVRWDPRSGPVQSATGGTLHIEDDEGSSAIPLDTVQLRSGFAAFRTQSAHPRPRLILRQPDGQTVVEVLREPDSREGDSL